MDINKLSILQKIPSRQTFSGFSAESVDKYYVEEYIPCLFQPNEYGIKQQKKILVDLSMLSRKSVDTPSPLKKPKTRKRKSRHRSSIGNESATRKVSTKEKINKLMRKGKKRGFSNTLYDLHLVRLAIIDRKPSMVQTLITRMDLDVAIERYSSYLNVIFMLAMSHKMESVCVLLLENGFPKSVNDSINLQNDDFVIYPSYFHSAISFGSENLVKLMIKNGADVNADWLGLTPLHIACSLSESLAFPIIKLLLSNGSDMCSGVSCQQYRLFMKLKKHDSAHSVLPIATLSHRNNAYSPRGTFSNEYIQKKRQAAFCLCMDPKDMIYPIDFSAHLSHYRLLSYMLYKKGKEDFVKNLKIVLYLQQDFDITSRLVKSGICIQEGFSKGLTPLHLAARKGNIGLVIVYLQMGIHIDVVDNQGWTPLHEAGCFQNRECMKYLISCGSDCSVTNSDGDTAIQLALKSGFSSEEIIEYFEASRIGVEGIKTMGKNTDMLKALNDSKLKKKLGFLFNNKKSRFVIEKESSYCGEIKRADGKGKNGIKRELYGKHAGYGEGVKNREDIIVCPTAQEQSRWIKTSFNYVTSLFKTFITDKIFYGRSNNNKDNPGGNTSL